jgi:hypothetical protein
MAQETWASGHVYRDNRNAYHDELVACRERCGWNCCRNLGFINGAFLKRTRSDRQVSSFFLAALWTIVGMTVLYDRRRPRKVQTHLDYRYRLTFEGLIPLFNLTSAKVPNAGALGFAIRLRNFSPGPLDYYLESVDIRLGTRTIPKYRLNAITGYLARGALRQVSPGGFEREAIAEFYGRGATKGTVEFSVTYGPPDEPPVRRLKLSIEFTLALPEEGGGDAGWETISPLRTMNRSATANHDGNIGNEDTYC